MEFNKSSGRTDQGIEQVGPRLRLAMQELTDRERQIVRDCMALGAELHHFSIQEIATRHSVSTAMVVKTAQRSGFSGFKEMKDALVTYSRLSVVDLHEELNPEDDVPTVVNKVFNTAINALRETLAILDFGAVERAAQALTTASAIDIYGVGGSGALALDAYHKFLRIGIRARMFTDSHLMVMSASLLEPGSVVLGFSHSGRTRALVEAFTQARLQKATTIAITNSRSSPLAERTDILLCSVAQGSPITGENAAARIVQLNILDALFVLVAQRDYDRGLDNLQHTIQAVANLRAV
jgi:DNA-binding MurR/RpiR family transcriptional regulator